MKTQTNFKKLTQFGSKMVTIEKFQMLREKVKWSEMLTNDSGKRYSNQLLARTKSGARPRLVRFGGSVPNSEAIDEPTSGSHGFAVYYPDSPVRQ